MPHFWSCAHLLPVMSWPFSFVCALILSCFAFWSETAHIQQVTCWGKGSLFQSTAFSCLQLLKASAAHQFLPTAFLCLHWDGKAGDFQVSPLWFHKTLIGAIVYEPYVLQRWTSFISLCCLRRRERLSATAHLKRSLPLLKTWHWSLFLFCSVPLTNISS